MIDQDASQSSDEPDDPRRADRLDTAPAASPYARLFDLAGPQLSAAAAFLRRALTARFGDALEDAGLDGVWLSAMLDREIAAIDERLTAQLNAILHATEFQKLEARWRGVYYLTTVASQGERAKLRLLDLSWRELVRDLERAADFDQSELFDRVYTQEFGSPGGEPYGLIIGDYEVQHRPSRAQSTDDVGALKSLAAIGAAAFTPIILGVSPSVFQLERFKDLGRPASLRTVFAQPEYERWLSLRDGDDMRYIGLAMPRILMRRPYRRDPDRRDGFPFSEEDGMATEDHLWGNAAFAFGSIVLRAYAASGWFADLRGAPRDEVRGGLVNDLPVISFATDRPGVAVKPSVEYMLSESQEHELTELGFIVLRNVAYTDYSVFYSTPSFQRPKPYDRSSADVNSRMSSMLQYTLCVSRFAHYIKILGRDRIGTNMTANECEAYLNRWLQDYIEGSDSASQEIKARCPLRAARVEVRDRPGAPGFYACTITLRPHYQLDDIAAGFKLTTELAPRLAA